MDKNDSAEDLDSDDMAGGLCGSDDEDGSTRKDVFKAMRAEKRSKEQSSKSKPAKREIFKQEFDTNVFQVNLSELENKGEVATGDAELCKQC